MGLKYPFIFAISYASTAALSSPPEMRSIQEYVDENTPSYNGSSEIFVGLRCASLYALLYKYSSDIEDTKLSQSFENRYKDALDYAINFQSPYNKTYTDRQLEIMIKAYSDRAQTSKALTGSFLRDEIIFRDGEFCTKYKFHD